jgi:hypothetical protein
MQHVPLHNEPTSLDIEFEKVSNAVIEGSVFVWITVGAVQVESSLPIA